MHKLYTTEGFNDLILLLQKKLDKNSVLPPNENRNSTNEYIIKKSMLNKLFSDTKIKKKVWTNDRFVTVNEFIEFMEEQNKSTDTMGCFHEYMEYIHTLYQVKTKKCDDEDDFSGLDEFERLNKEYQQLPFYHELTKKIRDIVEPKRDEFKFVWWIIKNINLHPFLSKYKDLLGITYQEPIVKKDKRFYDLLFNNINTVIEIQEDKGNHKNNYNDELKEAMVRVRGNQIYYLHIAGWKSSIDFLEELWFGKENLFEGIETILIKGILSYDIDNKNNSVTNFLLYQMNYNNYRNKKVLEKNIVITKKNIDKLEDNKKKFEEKLDTAKSKKTINSEISNLINIISEENKKLNYDNIKLDRLDALIKGTNTEYINIILEWYKESYNDGNKFIINPYSENFEKIFRIGKITNEFLLLSKICGICGKVNLSSQDIDTQNCSKKDLRISFNGLLSVFLNPNEEIHSEIIKLISPEKNDYSKYSRYMLDLLLSIKDTYAKVIKYISEHNKKNNDYEYYHNLLLKHEIDELKIEQNKETKKNEEICEIKDREVKFYGLRFNKIIRKVNTLKHKLNMAEIELNKKVNELNINFEEDIKKLDLIKDDKKKLNKYIEDKKKNNLLKFNIESLKSQMMSIGKDACEIEEYESKKKSNVYTIIYERNKSIIKEIGDFGVIYTRNRDDHVNRLDFIAYCKQNNVPIRTIKTIIADLCYSPDQENVPMIKFIDNENNLSQKETCTRKNNHNPINKESFENEDSKHEESKNTESESKDEESDKESDKESDTESKYEAESDTESDVESDAESCKEKINKKFDGATNKKKSLIIEFSDSEDLSEDDELIFGK